MASKMDQNQLQSAIEEVKEERQIDIPSMVSGTITDASGRTLSGQTVEAFIISICPITYEKADNVEVIVQECQLERCSVSASAGNNSSIQQDSA